MQGQKKNPTMISSVVKNRWTNKQVESRCHWPEDYFLLPAAVWSLSAMCHLEVQKKSNLIIHKSLQENPKKINESVAEEDNESTLTIRFASE